MDNNAQEWQAPQVTALTDSESETELAEARIRNGFGSGPPRR